MMLRLSSAAAALALALAATPHAFAAEWTTVSSFSGPAVDTQWRINGPGDAVSTVEGGVRIHSPVPVTIFRQLVLDHPVDTVELRVTTATPVQATFLWHVRNTAADRIVQLPVALDANGGLPSRSTVAVLNYPVWDRYADAIGLTIPAGADVTINEIRLIGLPWYERWGNAAASLFVFDNFTRHSINFLWGPLLAFDPETRDTLYDHSPPMAWSVNRVLLPTLALGLIAIAGLWWASRLSRRAALLTGLALVAGCWLLFDLRMGAELLVYARDDFKNYVLQPLGQRKLRGMADFHDSMALFLQVTKGKDRLGFVSDGDLLLDSSAVYEAYPRQIVLPGEPQDGVDTWLVYYRTDATVSPTGQLMLGDTPLSPPGGRIAAELSPHAAIFTIAP